MKQLLAVAALIAFAASCKTTSEQGEIPNDPEPAPTEVKMDVGLPPDAVNAVEEKPTGAEVYAQVCVTCHGKTGDGKGLEQELFGFDAPEEEWKNGPTVEGIMKTLQEGTHDSSMAAFPQFSEREHREVAEYVLMLRDELLGQTTEAVPEDTVPE